MSTQSKPADDWGNFDEIEEAKSAVSSGAGVVTKEEKLAKMREERKKRLAKAKLGQ